MKKRFNPAKFFGILLIALAAISLFTFLVMSLWNAVLVPVLHVSTVTFWQAAGILILSKILFGGFKGGGPFKRKHEWGERIKQRWEHMTPEQREKMKQDWRQRCSRWGGHAPQMPADREETNQGPL